MTTAPIPREPRSDQYPTDPGRPGSPQEPQPQGSWAQEPWAQEPRAHEPRAHEPRPRPDRPQVDAGKLWPGGIATAVVAGLIALVGVLVCRWLFAIPLLAPKQDGAYGDVHTTDLVLVAAAAALVATGLMHLLLLSTPRPLAFFSWIIGLATVLAVLLPFSTAAPLTAKVATAAVDLVLGIAIGTLLNGVAARSVRLPGAERGGYLSADPIYDDRSRLS
jgi:Family of unknown function (DUF6069)